MLCQVHMLLAMSISGTRVSMLHGTKRKGNALFTIGEGIKGISRGWNLCQVVEVLNCPCLVEHSSIVVEEDVDLQHYCHSCVHSIPHWRRYQIMQYWVYAKNAYGCD